MQLNNGDIIVFKNPITIYNNRINLQFHESGNNTRLYIAIDGIYFKYYNNDIENGKQFAYTNGTFYNFNGSIVIVGDQTITDENDINWLYENTVSGLPVREMEQSYQGTNSFLTATVANIGQIINPVISNPVTGIFTIGIFIVSIAVGILHRLRRKTF